MGDSGRSGMLTRDRREGVSGCPGLVAVGSVWIGNLGMADGRVAGWLRLVCTWRGGVVVEGFEGGDLFESVSFCGLYFTQR